MFRPTYLPHPYPSPTTRTAASDSDHDSIQGNVVVDEAPRGDGVRVLHARLPRVLGAPFPRALGFGGVTRLLRSRRLFNIERALVRDRVLLVRVLEPPLEVTPTGSAKKPVAFRSQFGTDRASHAGILRWNP